MASAKIQRDYSWVSGPTGVSLSCLLASITGRTHGPLCVLEGGLGSNFRTQGRQGREGLWHTRLPLPPLPSSPFLLAAPNARSSPLRPALRKLSTHQKRVLPHPGHDTGTLMSNVALRGPALPPETPTPGAGGWGEQGGLGWVLVPSPRNRSA